MLNGFRFLEPGGWHCAETLGRSRAGCRRLPPLLPRSWRIEGSLVSRPQLLRPLPQRPGLRDRGRDRPAVVSRNADPELTRVAEEAHRRLVRGGLRCATLPLGPVPPFGPFEAAWERAAEARPAAERPSSLTISPSIGIPLAMDEQDLGPGDGADGPRARALGPAVPRRRTWPAPALRPGPPHGRHLPAGRSETRHLGVRPGGRDDTFTTYRAELVPEAWRLTRKTQSRIFQAMTVPEILKETLKGFPVEVGPGRDVRGPRLLRPVPRERLRLREPADGGGGDLVLLLSLRRQPRDGRGGHPSPSSSTCTERRPWSTKSSREGFGRTTGSGPGRRRSEMRAGQVPPLGPLLRAAAPAPRSRAADGRERHGGKGHAPAHGGRASPTARALRLPGGYAQRFDGVDAERRRPAGRPPEDLHGQHPDRGASAWTQETAPAVVDHGQEQREAPGRRVTSSPSKRHFDARRRVRPRERSAQGGVRRQITGRGRRSSTYENSFACIPASVAFRPERLTPRPTSGARRRRSSWGPPGRRSSRTSTAA